MRKYFLITIVLIFNFVSSNIIAREVTESEKTNLETTISKFSKAFSEKDFHKIVDFMPPKIIKTLSKEANVSSYTLRSAIINNIQKSVEKVTFESFNFNMNSAKYLIAESGRPYVLIPTETIIKVEEIKVRSQNHTLAMIEKSKWYFARMDSASQRSMLVKAYPEFATTEFPIGIREQVK